jgi:hypothetical protein
VLGETTITFELLDMFLVDNALIGIRKTKHVTIPLYAWQAWNGAA